MDKVSYYEELKMSSKVDCRPGRDDHVGHWRKLYDFCQLEEIPDAFEGVRKSLAAHQLELPESPLDEVIRSRVEMYFKVFITLSLELLYGNDQLHLLSECHLLRACHDELEMCKGVEWENNEHIMKSFKDMEYEMTELEAYRAELKAFKSLCSDPAQLNFFATDHPKYFGTFDPVDHLFTSTNGKSNPIWQRLIDLHYADLKDTLKKAMVRRWHDNDTLYRRRVRYRLIDEVETPGSEPHRPSYPFCEDNKLLRYYGVLGLPITDLQGQHIWFHYKERLTCRLNLVLYALCAYESASSDSKHEIIQKVIISCITRSIDELNECANAVPCHTPQHLEYTRDDVTFSLGLLSQIQTSANFNVTRHDGTTVVPRKP